ncbi:AraC family transcriptional regulator [Paenibacillus ginsengarvi]|uniref:AraC family transcriptional regulator n=1 Tax=Paenibacillus ginsengarvi TaxID=400777 RepID=A0A3B0AWJ9_9BACL|nr:AraC family transcriptional regulator [Paenibacillus ginsengarvi]RKN64574.1 AraC family transcriptional regulator [Paenibacillus ginsengarvi]
MVRRQYALHTEFAIDKLYTFHYYELAKSFYTHGENHDFWELVYVDKGELEIFVDGGQFLQKQGDIAFYAPNRFHVGKARSAVNLMIVSFESEAPFMSFFEYKAFRLEQEERSILAELLKEALEAFDTPIDTLLYPYLSKKKQSLFGCEHLIKNYLEILLIKLLRRCGPQNGAGGAPPLPVIPPENKKADLLEQIIYYMKSRLCSSLTIEQICLDCLIGKTQLKALFQKLTGLGVMQYFNDLKIEEAKVMIREERYNFTEIAERLGFSSIHYFSSCFKKTTNMTPTEYARNVRARMLFTNRTKN